jgi:hypothetical protein
VSPSDMTDTDTRTASSELCEAALNCSQGIVLSVLPHLEPGRSSVSSLGTETAQDKRLSQPPLPWCAVHVNLAVGVLCATTVPFEKSSDDGGIGLRHAPSPAEETRGGGLCSPEDGAPLQPSESLFPFAADAGYAQSWGSTAAAGDVQPNYKIATSRTLEGSSIHSVQKY